MVFFLFFLFDIFFIWLCRQKNNNKKRKQQKGTESYECFTVNEALGEKEVQIKGKIAHVKLLSNV